MPVDLYGSMPNMDDGRGIDARPFFDPPEHR